MSKAEVALLDRSPHHFASFPGPKVALLGAIARVGIELVLGLPGVETHLAVPAAAARHGIHTITACGTGAPFAGNRAPDFASVHSLADTAPAIANAGPSLETLASRIPPGRPPLGRRPA